MLIDDETRTYWDHITGQARHGPLAGAKLESWPIRMTTVAEALRDLPSLTLSRSRPGLLGRLISTTGMSGSKAVFGKGFLPPILFRRTMGEPDTRLPELAHGLAVVVDGDARFYPLAVLGTGVTDHFGERALRVEVGADGVPDATWGDDGSRPYQIFLRWYGFAYTWPGGGIFEAR